MTRDLSSMVYISQLLADSKPWTLDPRCAPLPWREEMFQQAQSKPLTVGLVVDDGVVRVHPPIARALNELADKLRAAGHHVVDSWGVAISDHKTGIDIMDQFYIADGGEDIRRDVGAAGEPFLPHVEALVNRGGPFTVYEYWQLNRRKQAVQKRFLDVWRSGGFDVLLAPAVAHAAVKHRHMRWIGYTKIWNLVDYPALTFPVDEVRVDVDRLSEAQLKGYVPRNAMDEWNWNLYDVDSMAGLPINLQLIGQKLEEETVLGAAVAVEKAWRS